MILAEEGGAVTVQAQHFRQRCDVVRTLPGVARKCRRDFSDPPHVIHVVVATGKQGRPRGRAKPRGVKLVESQPLTGKAVGRWHLHWPAESAWHAEAHIIDKDDEYIGCLGGGLDLEAWRGLGIAGIEHRAARVVRFCDGQHRPVDFDIAGLRHG